MKKNTQLVKDIFDWHGLYENFTLKFPLKLLGDDSYDELENMGIEEDDNFHLDLSVFDKDWIRTSKSYAGNFRDCYIFYQCLDNSQSDYARSMMEEIGTMYVMVELIEEVENKLEKDKRVSDIILLSPRMKKVSPDCRYFYLGFNLVA